MENKTNGVSQEGCQCTGTGSGESFKEKMIRKVLESKALQTVLDFMVGAKAIESSGNVVVDIDANFDGFEFAENMEYDEYTGHQTLSSTKCNGKIQVNLTITSNGKYSLERK